MRNDVKATDKTSVPIYSYENKKHYGGKCKLNNQDLGCYSKKQIKILYPGSSFEKLAEYAPNSKINTAGKLAYKGQEVKLSKYRSNSRVINSEKGWVSVGEDKFVAILKNVVIFRILILVLCMAVIAAAIVLGLTFGRAGDSTSQISDDSVAAANVNRPELELEEGAEDWEGVQPRDTGGVSAGIAIPGYKSITIDAGETDVKVNLQNPAGNPCYFVISLLLDDGTELYKSKMIEPSKGLYEITLTQALEIGEYGATVKYETFSLDELNSLNGAEVKIMLIAE